MARRAGADIGNGDEYMEMMDLRRSGIYEIRHKASGRRYVGSAVSIRKRWGDHKRGLGSGRHHSRFLQRAWDKHGEEGFEFKALIFCDRADLLMYEQRFLDAWRPEYNTAPTAGSQMGYRHSDETKKRMSESRPKDFSPMTGKRHTEETKAKISESRKGKGGGVMSAERRAKIGAAHKGRVIGPEMRAKISATLTGGTTGRGSLSPDQVREIRKLRATGLGRIKIGKILGIKPSTVNAVTGNHAYGWVD